ncbi:mimivirus translation initiation factor 5 [Tupanvirus deep ocean]|uniref:Mimivirus translation initiation factor 5 n=2 Tax=Tupanvirus TaxID=2094720 RepID=A0AC62A7J3_9VIRU|nr:mimivirus translation initiation factor 5 [Tupanvirus deep ocean]QKU33755.1 mimivirus translation initiation factor 5 [Tupanvirus deep ocean]
MAMTNIGDSIDPFYRYRRPVSIVENKAGKTIITNLDNIAKALNTKSSYILYYIQLTKSTFITSKSEIKTVLTKSEVEELVNKFIEQYILCTVCKYPELITKKSGKKLYFSCNACGNTMDISEDKFTKIMYKDYK